MVPIRSIMEVHIYCSLVIVYIRQLKFELGIM